MKKLTILAFLFASFLPAQVQLGKNVQIGAGGSGGGLNPGLQTQIVQYPADGSLGGPSLVTTDAATGKNLTVPRIFTGQITNGGLNADTYATGSGNNGIANAFASADCAAGCTVVVPPTSSSTEVAATPPLAGQQLIDLRGGNSQSYTHDPTFLGLHCPVCANAWYTGNVTRDWGKATYLKVAGPAYDLGSGGSSAQGWSIGTSYISTYDAWSRGIKQMFGQNFNSHAIGDNGGFYLYETIDGGASAHSDEGSVGIYSSVLENTTYIHATIATGGTTGSNLLTSNLVSGQNNYTDGGFLLDISKGSLTGTLGSVGSVMGITAWNMTGATLPVSTAWGTLAQATTSAANGQFQIPVTQTLNVTLGTSPASPGDFVVGGDVCLVGQFSEQVHITAAPPSSGGVQSITFSTRYGWKVGAVIMQGAMCGQYPTKTGATWRTAIQAVGAFTSSQLAVAVCSHGDCTASANLSTVAASVGDSVTSYPGAEIIGTNGGLANTVQLGFNTAAWANGDSIEGPHPPAVNILPLTIIGGQTTIANPAGSSLFAERWSGVNPRGSSGLNNTAVNITDGLPLSNWWRITSSTASSMTGLFELDIPTTILFNLMAQPAAQQTQVLLAKSTGGAVSKFLSEADGTFSFDLGSALTTIHATNVPIVGTIGQIPVVVSNSTTPSTPNYAPVTVSGDAALASTGALTLVTVNTSPGACGDATHVCQVTTNGKGLVTSQAPVTITGTTYTLPQATTSVLGGVKVDGTTITAVAGVISAVGGGSGNTTSTSLTTNALTKSNGANSIINSAISDDGTNVTSTEPIIAPSFQLTGTTPSSISLPAGVGNIPALPANSGGFAAPVTGGIAYVIKMPPTITAGIPHYAAPATGDGVNESAMTVGAVTNADLANPSTTVNGVTCTLGSTCTITSTAAPAAFTTLTDSSSVTWAAGAVALANATLTMVHTTSTRAVNITGMTSGTNGVLVIKQDATGGAALTLGTGCTWYIGGASGFVASTTPTLTTTANAINILAFTYDGTNCYANVR